MLEGCKASVSSRHWKDSLRIRPNTLPVTVRLPLFAAVMIFVAAVASTQTAIFFMGRQSDRQVETLGQVYLDGLSAAVLPHAARYDDAEVKATLERALAFHEGIVDRRLAFVPPAGVPLEAVRGNMSAERPIPSEIGLSPDGFLRADDGTIWIWRELETGAAAGTVVANLDTSPFENDRWQLRWLLIVFDLVFSCACAVAGFFLVRRVQRPVTTVARHLYEAAMGMLKPIPQTAIPAGDLTSKRMILAFNAMANATNEREGLLAHMAEQQRQADLGRLTATIAHEVRNPLGGMRTAVSTLRRFGDQTAARNEATEFLDRGITALQGVVDATLETYRGHPEWRAMTRQDFEDLSLLVDADARSRDVVLSTVLDIPDTVPVAALDVRQVLLNLLLNAVRASGRNSTVILSARVEDDNLVVGVRDYGTGMDLAIARAIEMGTAMPEGEGLGVAVVMRLVERLQGRITIEADPEVGTTVTLRFPLRTVEEES